jgi:hypothetical protein
MLDVADHKLMSSFSRSSHIAIPCDIEILRSSSFSWCESLTSISFESNTRLTRIEPDAFPSSSLQSIVIPRGVEILGSSCFSDCKK